MLPKESVSGSEEGEGDSDWEKPSSYSLLVKSLKAKPHTLKKPTITVAAAGSKTSLMKKKPEEEEDMFDQEDHLFTKLDRMADSAAIHNGDDDDDDNDNEEGESDGEDEDEDEDEDARADRVFKAKASPKARQSLASIEEIGHGTVEEDDNEEDDLTDNEKKEAEGWSLSF
jgi:hypothetical protein